LGSWQTSNALALQASLCGSVTHRLHQPSPAAMRRAKAAAPQLGERRRALSHRNARLRLGGPISNAGNSTNAQREAS